MTHLGYHFADKNILKLRATFSVIYITYSIVNYFIFNTYIILRTDKGYRKEIKN